MTDIEKNASMKIVPPGKKKCVWMEAGVVSYKLCDNNYDCSTCVYDQAMQVKVSRQKESFDSTKVDSTAEKFNETWVDKMMLLPSSQRKCRYMITGEVGRKICPNAYECGNCSFDQMMQERLQAEPHPLKAEETRVESFRLPDDIYYHEGHTWARPEYGGRVRVGLDDFAQKLLGRLSRIETPNIGTEVKQGIASFQVRRNSEMVQVLSPVDGIVTHINHRLLDHPELVNESPYEKAWLFIVEPTKLKKNLKGLYYGEEAYKYINDEKERLFSMAHKDMDIAADGGISVEDIFGELENENWAEFVKKFLKT
ncbi:MAG TPA: glycine cleavage system protein H [Desulfobacteraceae bacterium]|nr:glycine cleavage system protein H [Desulfobacteraceae bacterium]HPJ67372.1 glycine cleavage system protein H [Desulfobacteraceae bacterium]HPQ28123.1 glycine cleavage system protein H [Desulfobacteraceae bacterium]